MPGKYVVGAADIQRRRDQAYRMGKATRTHGQSESRAYASWEQMKQRCLNPKAPNYYKYGGRGITIVPEWLGFEAFLEDMGPRPANTSIDRIDSAGNYEPGNCRWATIQEQNANRRSRSPRVNGGI